MKHLVLLVSSVVIISTTAQSKELVSKPVMPVEQQNEKVVQEIQVEQKIEAPTLKLTDITAKFTSDNQSGATDGNLGGNSLRLITNFAYGENWTGGVELRRYFTSNTKDSYGPEGVFRKGSVRSYVSVMRNNIFKDYGLGFTYESRDHEDRMHLINTFKPFEFLSGYIDYAYVSRTGGEDANYIEFQPKFSWNGWAMSYYFEGEYSVGNSDKDYQNQELRFFTPALNYKKFAVSGEWRTYINYDALRSLGEGEYGLRGKTKSAFSANKPYIHIKYNLNESTTIFTDLGYEFGDWKVSDNKSQDVYQTTVEMGVTYKF